MAKRGPRIRFDDYFHARERRRVQRWRERKKAAKNDESPKSEKQNDEATSI